MTFHFQTSGTRHSDEVTAAEQLSSVQDTSPEKLTPHQTSLAWDGEREGCGGKTYSAFEKSLQENKKQFAPSISFMAAISLLGFSLPEGIILSKAVNSNMASSVSTNSKQEATSLSKTFSKITVQNVLSENNGNSINISNNNAGNSRSSSVSVTGGNAIVRKIKDFGMVGAVNNAVGNSSLTTSGISKSLVQRKRPFVESKQLSSEKNKPTTPVTKKLKQAKESTTPKTAKKANSENVQRPKKSIVLNPLLTSINGLSQKPAGTPGRKGLPLPQAVARRNARERNRVKQVNNGFAALRERIPEEVAEAFESQGSGRGTSAKKLSKVETLRMAVEYIRNLEHLLGFDFSITGREGGQHGSGSSGDDSYTLIKDEFDALSPSVDENFDDSMSHYDMDDYFSSTSNSNNNDLSQAELAPPIDLLPDITTLNGLQYIRIPGTNTYQLLTPDIFVGTTHSPPNSSLDDEQFTALIDANCMTPTTPAVGLTTSPINANNSASPSTTTASYATPASPNVATAQYGECVSTPTLSTRLSPVPAHVQPRTSMSSSTSSSTSSPDAGSSSSLYQPPATATLSPASALINERTLQTCATTATVGTQSQFIAPTLPHLLQHFIKQEYVGDQVDFGAKTRSPSNGSNSVFQTTAAGDQHATLSLSPPLDRCSRLLIAPHRTSAIELQSFYEQDDSGSFYDNNLSFKKDLNEVFLDASTATNAGLSDESMIEAIDWWEAHTPHS